MRRVAFTAIFVALLALPALAQRTQVEEHEQECVTERFSRGGDGGVADDLRGAIDREVRDFVRRASKRGWLEIRDSVRDRQMKLQLDRLESDPTRIDDSRVFACTRFRARSGEAVDLDIVFETVDEELVIREATLHAVDEELRYVWVDDEGVLVRKRPSE